MQYKGFNIEIDSLGEDGYSCVVYRISDKWVLADEWSPNKKQAIVDMKITVDDYYENPVNYEDIE